MPIRSPRPRSRAQRALAPALALALLAGVATARADVVKLQNGEEVRGRVVREEADAVIVEVGEGRIRIPLGEIREIVREDEARFALGRGRDLLLKGRAEEAAQLLREAVLKDLPGARVLFLAALNQAGEGALAEARLTAADERFAEAARFAERVPAAARPAAIEREAARARLGREEVAASRDRARAAYLRGRAALDAGRLDEARADLRAAALEDVDFGPRVARPLAVASARAGVARANEGRWAEAAALLEQAHADDPTLRAELREPLLLCRIGAAARLALGGQDDRAEALLARAAADDPESRLAHFYLGVLWEGRGEGRRAAGHYRDALRGAPGFVPAGDLAALRAAAEAAAGKLPVPVEALWQAKRLEEARAVLAAEARRGPYIVRAPDPASAAAILAAVERAARDVSAWAGPEALAQPIAVYAFVELQTLHRASGQRFHALGITRSHRDPKTGALVPEIYTALEAPDLLGETIPHEVAHALVGADATRPLPLWLNEGLAVMSEPEAERAFRIERYRAGRGRGAGLGLVDVVAVESYPEGDDALLSFYDGATALTAHLVAAHGRAGVLAAARREPTSAPLLASLGLGRLEALERAVLGPTRGGR